MTARKDLSKPRDGHRRGSPTKRTPENAAKYLAALAETGSATAAMKEAGLSRAGLYVWRKEDPEFEARCLEAKGLVVEAFEDEAARRAVEGVEKPVYQGGKLVGKIREYSDTLLIFLLKANKPEKYRERVEHTGKDGGPINVTFTPRDAGVL